MFALMLRHVPICDLLFYYRDKETKGFRSKAETWNTLQSNVFVTEMKRLRVFALMLRHVILCDLMFYYRDKETKG